MKIPNLKEMIWISPPDMGGENISSIMRRYMEFLGWRNGENPCLIYVGSESQLEKGIETKTQHPHIPLILNFWGWIPERFLYPEWRELYAKKINLIEKYADVITVPSILVAEQLRILGITRRIDIISPGVDTLGLLMAKTEALKYTKPEPFILSIGRLVPHKNFQMVIEALSGTSYKYIIIGSGENKAYLLNLAKEKNVNLQILESSSDLDKGELISLAKVIVVPSTYEGFGLPIIEGITISIPVLAKDISSSKELFGDNLEYFSGIENLKSKIKKIFEDEDYREKISTKEAILALRYSGFNKSLLLNALFKETIATILKDSMKSECTKGNNSLADAYNLDALLDVEYFKYRLDPNTQLFFFRVDPLLRNLSGQTVLDVGSSTGIFALYMAKAGYHVTSIDIAEEYLKIVKNLSKQHGLEEKINTQICDATKLEGFEKESFDNVWAGEIIEHFEDSSILIKELMSALKPNGRLLLTVPYKDACYDAFHLKEFHTEDDIKAIFKDYPKFEFKEIKKIGSPGGKHNNWFAWGIKNA